MTAQKRRFLEEKKQVQNRDIEISVSVDTHTGIELLVT